MVVEQVKVPGKEALSGARVLHCFIMEVIGKRKWTWTLEPSKKEWRDIQWKCVFALGNVELEGKGAVPGPAHSSAFQAI